MLEAKNLSLTMGNKHLLRDINFSCQAGQLIALCGPNGAGKSTLLKALAGDNQPQQGHVFYHTENIKQLNALTLASRRSVMPQSLQVSFNLSAQAVVEMGLIACQNTQQAEHIVMQMADLLDIKHLLGRVYNSLSGGEQQRVQLARVIGQIRQHTAASAGFLLLDECTSAMDMAMTHKVFSLLQRIKQENLGIIAVVHDLNLASLYADHIVMLKDGASYAEGCPKTVLTKSIIHQVFQASVEIMQHPTLAKPVIVQTPN